MKKILLALLLSVAALFDVSAQRVNVELEFSPALDKFTSRVYMSPLGFAEEGDAKGMRFKDGVYAGALPESNSGFYNIVAVVNNRQLLVPVFLAGADSVKLKIEVGETSLKVGGTADNMALSDLNSLFAAYERRLWTEAGLDNAALKSLLKGFAAAADSVIEARHSSKEVVSYMKAWAYTKAYLSYGAIPRAQRIAPGAVEFAIGDILPKPQKALDNDYASLFPAANMIVNETLPGDGTLTEKLDALYSAYKNRYVRSMASASIMSRFLMEYDYAADFEGGLSLVNKAVEKYGLSESYANEYSKRKCTIPGSKFPEEVVLVDADGNVVDFSSFKGKYVYVDVWASWCGPCCKEVPFLKAMETELENDNVVFLSISVDKDGEAWKSKMKELDMHGNQLFDKDNSLCKALNVMGIPFFAIYDKEGRLHTYNAPRPSKSVQLKKVLENLK